MFRLQNYFVKSLIFQIEVEAFAENETMGYVAFDNFRVTENPSLCPLIPAAADPITCKYDQFYCVPDNKCIGIVRTDFHAFNLV